PYPPAPSSQRHRCHPRSANVYGRQAWLVLRQSRKASPTSVGAAFLATDEYSTRASAHRLICGRPRKFRRFSAGRPADRDFAAHLHRPLTPAGRAGWMNALASGMSEIEDQPAILVSPEYQAAPRDNAAFVDGLYADAGSRSAWLLALGQ